MHNITNTPPEGDSRADETPPAEATNTTEVSAGEAGGAKPDEPTISQALDHAWKNRDKASAEAKRLVVEGPSEFRKADLSSKVAVIALFVVLVAFIANTVWTPRQAEQREALEGIGNAFSGVGENLDKATDKIDQSKFEDAADNAGKTIQKIAAPAEQPSPAADKAANEDKTTDAPDRP